MTADPSQRRRDPQPISRGWEAAAAAVGGALIAVTLAALTGLGLASALFGGGWVWPHGTETITHVLGGLLHGHPGRGLPPGQLREVAGPVSVYACVAATELALVAAAVAACVLIARYRRPGDARGGMATRREAEQILGLGQLRAAQAVIRPDRYRSRAAPGRRLAPATKPSVHRTRGDAHRSEHESDPQPTSVAPSTPARHRPVPSSRRGAPR